MRARPRPTSIHGNYPQQAARWFTAGLARQLGHLTDLHINDLLYDSDLAQLARGRHEARQALSLAPDHIDELAEELRQNTIQATH